MYKSPIEIIQGELEMQLEGEIMKAVQRVGVNVDKEELIKAVQYDREQYKKGYEDGLNACKWIPCSERMPEEHGRYLLSYGKDTRIFIEEWDGHCFSERHYCQQPKAWMELPEPWKGE